MYGGAETFEYRFLPLFLDVPPIARRSNTEGMEGKSDEDAVATIYLYPFDTLPPIFATVNPHFVVYDAGRKLDLIFRDSYTIISVMARIYGITYEKADFANMVMLQTYRTWTRPARLAHLASFVTSSRRNDSRSRSGLIGPGQPSSVSQGAGRSKGRVRETCEVSITVRQQWWIDVGYAASLSRTSHRRLDSILEDSDSKANRELEKKRLRRAIKASKRWVKES